MLTKLLAVIWIGARLFGDDGSTQDLGLVPGATTSTLASTSTSTTSTATTTTAPTATVTTSSSTSTTATTLPATAFKSIYAGGYFGVYDGNSLSPTTGTLAQWPRRLQFIQGSADGQGPFVAPAKVTAQANGNGSAKFLFYSSLTSLDITSGYDSRLFTSFATVHPEWILHDAAGNRVWTFVPQLGTGVQVAIDIGNPALVDAWGASALGKMDQYGWDGVFADNVEVNDFYGWSPRAINPRTHNSYTVTEYRRDLLAALQRLRASFDARGKVLIGNHTDAPVHFADPVVQQQVTAMYGVRLENCVYNWNGTPLPEVTLMQQLAYLAYANQHGVVTQCQGVAGTINNAATRDHVVAFALLTKEGFSGVAELNGVGSYWAGLDVSLGAPAGPYEILGSGAIRRTFARGVVAFNPHPGVAVAIPLGRTTVSCGATLTITGPGGRVCQ
jgi:hypothetical protein